MGGIKKVIGGGCCVITGQTGNTDLVALWCKAIGEYLSSLGAFTSQAIDYHQST